MNHYRLLIKKYGQIHWKRTLLTIIGIALSVSLMSFSTIFIHNLKETIFYSTKYSTGYYHMSLSQPSKDHELFLRLHQKIKYTGKVIVKVENFPQLESSIQFMSLDTEAKKIFKDIMLIEGSLPKDEKEIVLEEWIAEKAGIDVGENIRIGDFLFELVGICKDRFNSKSNKSSIGYLIENHPVLHADDTKEILYIQFHEQYIENQANVDAIMTELSSAALIPNENLKRNEIVYKAIEDYTSKDYSSIFIIIVNLLVMGLFIFNTFQISILERTQHYGILRTLGATPNQIYRLVMFEAIIYSVIAIPIGICLGLAFQGFLQYVSLFQNTTKFTVPYRDLLILGMIGFVTILFSVYRPAFAASKVSPIQAIKQTPQPSHLIKFKKVANEFLLRRLGISAHLAWQNILRNRARFIGATLSMSVAIILVILNFSFFSSQDPAVLVRSNYLWSSNYYITSDPGFTDQDRVALEKLFSSIEIIPSKYEDIEVNTGGETANIRLNGFEVKELEKANRYIVSGKINITNLQLGNEVILVIPSKTESQFSVGDSLSIKTSKGENYKVSVGAIVENYPTIGDSDQLTIVAHMDLFNSLVGEQDVYRRFDLTIEENDKNHFEISRKLEEFVENGKVRSLFENIKSIEKDFDAIKMLMVGFICIISFIGLFSIYNTLATSFLLRTNEFGVLRAVGMTMSQLRKMVVWEGIFYGLFSAFWGVTLGMIIHYLQYKILNALIIGFYPDWNFPITISLITCVFCIMICIATSLFSSKKLKLSSIIDSIKLEN